MRIICHCECHRDSLIAPFRGADVYDAVEAVTACDSCRRSHCVALLERRVWWDEPEPPQPALFTADPEE